MLPLACRATHTTFRPTSPVLRMSVPPSDPTPAIHERGTFRAFSSIMGGTSMRRPTRREPRSVVGKRANLLFLRKNPLHDIANTESIDALYVGGHHYDSPAREAVMEEVAAKAKGARHALVVGWFLVADVLPAVLFGALSSSQRVGSR